MKRIAVIGGGIAGLAAAYELARQQRAGVPVDFTLFEASPRLGGIVKTERRDGFVIECGPDSWVTEKPGARELAVELGLESKLISSLDDHRRTYLAQLVDEQGILRPLPEGLRMGIPVEWTSVLSSPLLSAQAKLDYQQEPKRASELKAAALDASRPPRDESVRDFFVRHFGTEVADTIVAPLMAGVFGGDIARLSARAVLPPSLIRLEHEHGSLILGLEHEKRDGRPLPIFTTLREGLAGLVEGMESRIPVEKIRRGYTVRSLARNGHRWQVHANSTRTAAPSPTEEFDAVLVATPAATTASFVKPLEPRAAELLPSDSSSALVVALAYSAERARNLKIPVGFGFLVPQRGGSSRREGESDLEMFYRESSGRVPPGNPGAPQLALSLPKGTRSLRGMREKTQMSRKKRGASGAPEEYILTETAIGVLARQSLLACTFVDQKFANRVPAGGRLLRAFFGGPPVSVLLAESDAALQALARDALGKFLGELPEPSFSIVRRWPQSLPLYTVGHVQRMVELDRRIAGLPSLRLIGNAYRGVGLPDLIRDARKAAREIATSFTSTHQ